MADQTAGLVLQAARLLFRPGDVVELRVPKAGREGTVAGYFDDFEALAKAAAQLEARKFPGVYWTLNPVDRALLARASNRIKSYAKVLTGDDNILSLRWLYVDLDPKRPADISSTDEQNTAALALGEQIRAALSSEEWPAPVYAASGNGAHLLYRVELVNEQASEQLVKRILQALGARFDNAIICVDQTTFNPSRICKTYGTTARKGDSIPEYPHRLSRLVEVPDDELLPVPLELLQRLAATAPQPAAPATRSYPRSSPRYSGPPADFDLQHFLNTHGIRHHSPVAHKGGWKYVLECCPFDASHQGKDAAVFDRPDGLGFKCFHNSCANRDWREFRALFEPDAYAPRPVYTSNRPPEPPLPPEPADLRKRAPEPATELPVSAVDVEEAFDTAIAGDDMVAAMRLVPEAALLNALDLGVVKSKLRQKWDGAFLKDFEKALKAAISDESGQSPPSPPGGREGRSAGDGPNLLNFPLTDAGNGERIAALFGKRIRYCTEFKKWLVWDGKRWAIDEAGGAVRQKAKQMARLLYLQAIGRRDYERHALASESYAGMSNALGCAATESGIAISALQLDQHPYKLNCLNGMLDLEPPGRLLPHDPDLLLTKLCPVEYDALAGCPRFMEFIEWAMGAKSSNPDAELDEHTLRTVSFLQRAFGSALTDDVADQAIFICYGKTGNNGKTTLLKLFRRILGRDYAGLMLIDTVMAAAKNQDATMRADLADLRGTRLVVTSEVDKEQKLNEARIKQITQGLSDIKSCRKYENPIEFPATHKLWMDCNHRPRVTGTDDAIWKRLKLIPFEARVSDDEKDKKLPAKLWAEAPGILAWAVKGCVAWQKEGLGSPPEISEAGIKWRQDDDLLKDFLEDCCEVEPEAWLRVSELAAAYEWWCKEHREKFPLGREGFNDRLEAKGFSQSRSRRNSEGKQMRTWEGLQLQGDVGAAVARRTATKETLRD